MNLLLLTLFLAIEGTRSNPIVTSVSPVSIGDGGGTITILGEGFSEDVFNQFDPVLGNKVWFANEFVSVSCQTPINWNFLLENPQDSSTTKITCDLPPRDGLQGSDWFSLILKVDGIEVENSKAVRYTSRLTPLVRDVFPRYGRPGDQVSLSGRVFTKEYGNANFGDESAVDDRRDVSIMAIMMGSRECELTDDLGNVYNMALDSSTSNEGTFTCIPGGSFIGPMNATIFVSSQHGKSKVDTSGNGYSVNSKNQLFMYHTLPEITSVSPNVGASTGSTQVKITGNSFDSYPGNTVVKIGDTPCKIISVSNNELICSTPAEEDVAETNAGPRGLLYEIWTDTEGDVSTLDSSADDYYSMTIDGSTVEGPLFNETNGFSAKLSGLFIAPYSGKIAFYLTASDAASLYLSTDESPDNKVEIISHSAAESTTKAGSPHSAFIEVVEGQQYYMEAVHTQKSSSSAQNILSVSLWESKTSYHSHQTNKAKDERQRLEMIYNRNYETQSISFNNIPDSTELTFTHVGKKAKEIVTLSNPDEFSRIFTDMLTYSCEYQNTNSRYKQDFEKADSWLPGQYGYVQENVQAYCGAKALENQVRITSTYNEDDVHINAGKTPWLCFAAMGTSYTGALKILYVYEDDLGNEKSTWMTIPNLWTPSEEWSYQCIDMLANARNTTISPLNPSPSSKIEVKEVFLGRGTVTGKYYMDEITISSSIVEIVRTNPALASDLVMIKEVNVEAVSETEYDLEIVPWTCNSEDEDFSLLGVKSANIVGLDTTGMTGEEKWNAEQDYLRQSESVTFESDSWGAGSITVSRKVRGSRKMTGTFSLSYKNKTISLPPYPTDSSLAPALEAFGMIGVSTTFIDNKCFNTIIDIAFDNSLAGNVDQIEIDTSNLVVEDDGTDSNKMMMSTRWDGGIMVSAPGGDFFRKLSTDKSVNVFVGGFLSACSAPDCSFAYDAALTPSVSSVEDSVVDGNIVLTISGSGFSAIPSENIVNVGDLVCTPTVSTESTITCSLESGPAGDYDISVIVANSGLATGGPLTFTIPVEIFSNSPVEGSLGGGTAVTVLGSGFPGSLEGWVDAIVTIDGSICSVIETSFSSFKCITSPKSLATRKKRSASEISVVINGLTVSGGSYTYDQSLTPVVSTLSTTSSTPLGGEELTIEGSAFGAAWGVVAIGDNECSIVSWMANKIVCNLPGNGHGTYPVHVSVPGNGFADVSGVDEMTYTFQVSAMSPKKGSLMGGTQIKIKGEGFGTCENLVVSLGDIFECNIQDCTDSKIECLTVKKSQVKQIVNSGRHPVYGPGYKWSESDVTINPGDTVEWVWNLQVASDETQISVHEVDNEASDEYNGNGFKSMKGGKGRFSKKFMNTGIYYYSSDPVFQDSLFMKGIIRVVSSAEDIDAVLSVSVNSIEAAHDVSSAGASVSFSGCNVSNDLTCASDSNSTTSYIFKAAACLTPRISAIDISEGNMNMTGNSAYSGSSLTISGSGFSPKICQNIVKIGDSKCAVDSSTESEIVCTIDGSDSQLSSLEKHEIQVSILNLGNAVFETGTGQGSDLVLVPRVESASVVSGSWGGGNIITFSGTGLIPDGGKETVLVTFGAYPYSMRCAVMEATYNSISCVVPDFSAYKGSKTSDSVVISISLGYDSFDPVVDQINYEFMDSLTSQATSMDSSSVVVNDNVEITGSNFNGDVKVYLKKVEDARLKRRSPLKKRAIPSLEGINLVETSNSFWSIITEDPINWKCADGNCGHDAITGGMVSEPSERRKRSAEEDTYLQYLADMDDMSTLNAICLSDVNKCHSFVEPKNIHFVEKRSTEEELLEMSLGESFEADVTATTSTSVTFAVPALPAGDYDVIVSVQGQGNSLSSLGALSSTMVINDVQPTSGSIHGGQTIVVSGSGFCTTAGATNILIGSDSCAVVDVTPGSITCVTRAGADGAAVVSVESCSLPATGEYTYSSAMSPEITSISPESASGPVTLSIEGSNFGSDPVALVGDNECSITASTETLITCELQGLPGGDYSISVKNIMIGLSNSDVLFTSVLNLDSVTPASGSFGGGSVLVLGGVGFDDSNSPAVTVCSNVCTVISVTTSEIQCLSPSNSASGSTEVCDVEVTQSSGSIIASSSFTYDRDLTPTISSISPVRGGTGGGTRITISGSGFASTGNQVHIDGSICDIESESSTEISCYTNFHNGAIEAPVIVEIPSQGYASYTNVADATFFYIDRWSSIWTWGGTGTPMEGEYIVITNGQTILLDESTPVLKFLLIKGGTLIFDQENPDLELQTEYILVVEGGKLQIGSEEEPYESKATITMHGNVRCTELPIFGCKVIGVRNGTLDFHGEYVPVTWTHLAETASAGSTDITLKQPVTWKSGDQIVIATTSDRNSMRENEEREIASVSADGYTVTLTEPLTYQHISIVQTFGDREVESRGEVGLLTRNILVRGSMNEQFVEVLPACEEEFSSGGAFSDSLQTCFSGKFGEELGHDEMGAIIILSPKYKDQGLVEARIEYTEFSNVGQAFRVGRYPIHFHLPGNMSGSYIRGNAIHHSNNRACTLHDVSNLLVEHNVAYNIKGLTFFLEDGVEQENILQYNLAVFTRMSNSLLNPDINPASFWIVNPNNKFRHNSCAGGTHHCFWLRPARVPDGPSFTRNFCPFKVPFDEFHNNTAHSMGWYGFWIMGQSNHVSYDPHSGDMSTGYCSGERVSTAIGSFTTWNNKRGFEIVSGANIRLENQTHMDHDFAGFEIFTAKGPYGNEGPGIFNSVIVGHSEISDLTEGKAEACTPGGIFITDEGYTIKDTKFFNFDREGCSALTMRLFEPGATVGAARIENVEFINSPNKIFLKNGQDHGAWLYDVDGSLTGQADSHVIGNSMTNPSSCTPDSADDFGSVGRGGHSVSVCPGSVKFHRTKIVGENSPTSLRYNPVILRTENGNSSRNWGKMLKGWHALMSEESINWLLFESSEHVTNISYSISASGMYPDGGNYVLIGHEFYQTPDRFSILEGDAGLSNASTALTEYPSYENSDSGDWFFTNETDDGIPKMVYILSDKGPTSWSKKKRDAEEGNTPSEFWAKGAFTVFRCLYENCIPPPPPTLPPGRPLDFHKWSNTSAWESFGSTQPSEGDVVTIPPGVWMVMDMDPPPLKRIYLYGGLEIMDDADHALAVEIILIQGGKFECGTQETPHVNNFELILTGNHFTEDQPLPNGPNLGAKALGVFGFLDMHGVDTGVAFTKLASDVNAGDTTIELVEPVSWAVGSEIVISTTSYELKETERRTIVAVSGTTITVDIPVEFKHTSQITTLEDGTEIKMRGEVGLLTKNVRIVGNDYPEIVEEEFGARVLVGSFEQDDVVYTGFARFSNVEFANAGQEGWFDSYDPRYALAFLDTGDSTDANGAQKAMESYVKKCSFNYLYNSAIGVFGSNNIPVEDNVIYRFLNDGILDEGIGNRINGNLVTMGECVGRIKMQTFNFGFYGCINIRKATNTTLQNNVMAGCAQGGLYTIGSPCENDYLMTGNEIHSAMHGVHLDGYGTTRPASGCVKLAGILAWKNFDYGVQTKSESSVILSDLVIADNGAGILPYIYGPPADSHQIEDKFFTLKDSHIVAVSDNYDCAEEVKPDIFSAPVEGSRKWTGRGRSVNDGKAHHTGIIWPVFQSGYGKTSHPWYKPTKSATGTNPALRGIMNIENVTFANFGSNCEAKDVVFRTNFGEDDVNWPINATDIKYISVDNAFKIYVDEPNKSKINPADCTDFDCDGFKKAIIFDNDGSVAGDSNPGTIIPDAGFEWDGNPARGIGYYRVPKPMITELNGDKIKYADKMPNTGIYRDDSCVFNEDWRAYKCQGINHRMLIIESMDRDTKIRRLSPVAVLANPGSNGFIDLVNGPQDFSCCEGYTCAERLSTMFTMVATGIEYEIMFSSTPPQNIRLHLLHNEGGDAVLTKIYFPVQQRLDIYVDGMFVMPNNIDNTKDSYSLLPPGDSFIPALTETNGANYFDPGTGHLYVNIKGPSTIDIKTQPIVVLKLGMTVPIENFFEENVIANIAGLLGIDPSNIRITNIVREGSVGKKRSATETITSVEFEIAPPPLETLENFMPEEYNNVTPEGSFTVNPLYSTTSTTTTTTPWIPPANYLSFEDLQNVESLLANNFQTGNLGTSLGLNITDLSMVSPIAPPQEPPEYTSPEERAQVLPETWAEQSLNNDTLLEASYEETAFDIPESLRISREPEGVKEMEVISPSFSLYVATATGKMVVALGTDSEPWICTASIFSGPGGSLLGELTAVFEDGVATFDNLHIDAAGSDYVLQFEITSPAAVSIAPVASLPIEVQGRPLGMKFTYDIELIPQNTSFSIVPDIWDEALDMVADASILNNFDWECSASLLSGENAGVLNGTLNITVAAGVREVIFDDLYIDVPGMNYQIQTSCFSPEYNNATIEAISPLFHVYESPEIGLLRKTGMTFTFEGPFSKVEGLLTAFDSSMGEITCTGCPETSLPARKRRDAEPINQETP